MRDLEDNENFLKPNSAAEIHQRKNNCIIFQVRYYGQFFEETERLSKDQDINNDLLGYTTER